MSIFIDVHVLQTVPPSNLNRDDAGSPKAATYGGVRRARVSSQAWKRATRLGFNDNGHTGDAGAVRTKRVTGLIADRLITRRPDVDRAQALRIANAMLGPLGLSNKKGGDEIDYLMFLGHRQVDDLIDTVDDLDTLLTLEDDELAKVFDPKKVTDAFSGGHPIDVALFGRMVADIAMLRVDASCQVAHAISTHAVENEFDYFTAVDEEKPADESAGAAHIGTVEFNSSTLYRYANVSLEGLTDNLDGDADRAIDAVRAFIHAFALEMPSGKSNTFANRTLPSAVVATIRDGAPVNAATAFEEPLIARNGSGYTSQALDKLAAELAKAEQLWVDRAMLTVATYDPDHVAETVREVLGDATPLTDLLDTITGQLTAVVTAGR